MNAFFDNDENKRLLTNYRRAVTRLEPDNSFEQERNQYITRIIDYIISSPKDWDEGTQINISYFGDVFKMELAQETMSKTNVDAVFSSLYRFFIEKYISTPGDMTMESRAIRKFATERIDSFEEVAREQINYAMNQMTLSMFKTLYNEDGLKAIRNFSAVKKQAEDLKGKWDEELKLKEDKVVSLNAILTNQQDSYNFVGLHAGFAKLGRIKVKELFWSRMAMLSIGILIPALIIAQAFFYNTMNTTFEKPMDLVKIIPGASITLIMIYYFRVTLGNYSSVRAQIMQIELRKSLCRFIQRYSEYSEGISAKNPQLLAKFEDVIFSNIMASEDKIPSTFDGIEQMANFISSLKPKG
ncbi:hypothetical protein K5Y32_06930 [Pantoea sp. DY-15]|uniref:hypothetical protein n=1 Tax=Pantoea sp. DY-15 TaxID=2871489 RepID=UPI001C97B843|nr:hypothetical protein [Pantoea sp. DY-15]MBY4887664.1 hypothetical protein [Pantoea sp. DY-15]